MPDNIPQTPFKQANLITRYCAWAIVGMLYGSITLAASLPFIANFLSSMANPSPAHPFAGFLPNCLISIGSLFFCFSADACFAALFGNEAGKMILGLRVVKEDGSPHLAPTSGQDSHDTEFVYQNDKGQNLADILIDTDTCRKLTTH